MITCQQQLIKLFEACKDAKSLTQLHSLTIRAGLAHDTFFSTKLIDLYSKFTSPKTTHNLFDETPHRNAYIWNCMLRSYCRGKHYKESLFLFSSLFSSEKPDGYAASIALKACSGLKALDVGRMINGFVRKSDKIGADLFVGSALVEMYSKCGSLDDAVRVFDEYSEPDTVLWTTMITGYEQNGEPEKALDVFARMVMSKGVVVDSVALITVLSACAQMLNLKVGRSVHGYMIRMEIGSCLPLLNALLSLYGKTGSVDSACKLFKKMEGKDVISWGSIIACYAHHGHPGEALDLFNKMVSKGVEPNVVVLISAIQACEATRNLEEGKRIHELAAMKGLDLDILITTALIDMYMNCSSPHEAIEIFEKMPEKDAVSFSSLLHGCVQNGIFCKSIGLFRDMLANEFQPDAYDMVKVLTACSELGVLKQTSCIHGFVLRNGLDMNFLVSASLIESYAKCGNLDGSIAVFSGMSTWDVVIWSAMFAAYGFYGKGLEALEMFDYMTENSKVRPNDVTFVSLLSACSHAGLVKEGIKIFNMMVKDYKISPNSKHYGIIVDLLGRIGDLHEALLFIKQMQEPVEANVWGALLGACRKYQNMEIGEIAGKELRRLDPSHAGHYVSLSNLYAVDGQWDNVDEVRNFVKEKQLKKMKGQSFIELRDE